VVRFRPGGNGIAYSTWSRQVAFFDAANDDAAPLSIESQSPPRDIVFDQLGRRMAISWGNGQVGIYDARTGDQQRMVDAQTPEAGFYMRIALSPSGDLLATRGPGETIQLFQLDSDAAPRVVGSHGGVIRGLAFSGDGQLLASASEDRTAKIWTVRNGQEVVTLQGHTSKVISIAFSPEDDMIATGGDDGTLRLWEAQTGRPLLVLNASMPSDLAAHGIQAVAFSEDGRRVAAASQAVSVYEIRPRRIQRLPGHGLLTTAVAFHPQRPMIATSSKQQDVTFWNRETGRELHRRDGMAGMPGYLSFSGDGSLLAVAPLARVPTLMIGDDVSLLESETGRIRHTFAGCFSSAVAFDPTGQTLAVGDRQGQVWLFEPTTGELRQRCSATNGWITDVAFIHDGAQLVIGDVGGQVLLWDLKQNRQIGQAALPGGLFRLTVDPPQRLLAVANFMNEVRILSLPDLRIVATLGRADEPAAVALAFRNDGKWLAVGGADRRVTIWDTRSFDRSFTMPTMNAPVLDLAFQSDGSHLAVATADELIPIWDYAALEADLDQLGLLGELPAADNAASRRSPPETVVDLRRTGGHQLIPLEWSIWLLEHMLEIEPEQPQACMELAWLRVMGPKAFRDSQAALPLAQRAVKLAPNQAECLNTLGVVYYRLGRWDDAINTLHAAARSRPAGASGSDLLFLAMSYHKGGRPDVARVQFEQAIHWWNRAQLTAQQVAELTAIQVEVKLVLQGSDDPPAIAAQHLAAGRTCANLRLWNMAARQFDLAAVLAPSDPQLWDECGRAYAHLGQWQDAVRCFATAVEMNSGNVEFWYHHAIAYAGAEDLEGYQRICAAMVDRFRDTNDAGIASRILYACVVVEGAGADSDELVRLAKIAVPWFRGNVRVLGAALYRDGQVESARQRFDELDSVHTAKAWDWLFRAMCHARLNQPAQARQCLERAATWIERADQLDFGNSPDRWVDWFEQVELGLLRTETEEILRKGPIQP
jgi:WD40 repeat protein/tetratricopeptide (TPR) repeat protein